MPGYSFLSEFSNTRLVESLDNLRYYLGVGLIGFEIVAVMCFLVGWIPFVRRKTKELMKVREFIGLLPLEMIIKMKGFRNFFAQIVFTQIK